MKPIMTVITLLLSMLVTTQALAAKVHCGPAKLERTYQKDGAHYVQLAGQGWHVLGYDGDSDLETKLNKLNKAERKGRFVQLVFPSGYPESCMQMQAGVVVTKVKLKKTIDGEDEEES